MKGKTRTPLCTRQSDEMSYFTFWPLIIFSFYYATEKEVQHDLSMYDPSAQLLVWFFITLTHMFCINTIVVSVIEVYTINFYSTKPLCKRTRVLEYNGVLATVSLMISVMSNAFGSLFIDLNREGDDAVHRPAWLRITCWVVSSLFLSWSVILIARNRRKS